MEQPEGQPPVRDIVRKAYTWKAVGFNNVYSVRLTVTDEYLEMLSVGADPEVSELIGVPDDIDWDAVIKMIEEKHEGAFRVRWFYYMGTVDDLYLKETFTKPTEE